MDEIKYCKYCNDKFDKGWGTFCSRSCAISHRNKIAIVKRSDAAKQKQIVTRKQHYAEGKFKMWQTGLTKENCKVLRNRGQKWSETLKEKYTTGERIAWQKGLTKETDNRLKLMSEKVKTKMKWIVENTDFIKKSLRRHEKSSLEIKLENIIMKNNLPYKFVGNGEAIIANKCPDFVHTDENKKIAVETFCTKHKEKFRHGGCEEWIKNRQEIFEKEEWKVLFFNEVQLNDENKVVQELSI